MDIKLHQDKCLSCGMCASIAPELFSLDTGVVNLKKQPDTFDDADNKQARDAADSCPNAVIEITE